MELSTVAVAVSSCGFRPPAARLGSAKALSLKAIETSNVNLRRSNARRRKIRVGATAGTLFGQQMGISVASGVRWTASTWLDNTAQVEADVPLSEAWALWSNQENVVNWMPWIASVKVIEGKPNLSKWTLRYSAFGQNFEFSWMARLLKIYMYFSPSLFNTLLKDPCWTMLFDSQSKIKKSIGARLMDFRTEAQYVSIQGGQRRVVLKRSWIITIVLLANVEVFPSQLGLDIMLTISYEVPDVLAPFASGVKPLVENILKSDLDRFAVYAKKESAKKTIPQK